MLRLQLEILSHFSYSDPEVLLQDLTAAVAFADASPRKHSDGSPHNHSNQAAHPHGNGIYSIAHDDRERTRRRDSHDTADTDASISPPPARWKSASPTPANTVGLQN